MTAEYRTLGALRAVLTGLVKTSPCEAIAGAVLLLVLTFTEGAGVLLLAPMLELVGVVEDNPLPRAAGWLEAGFAAVGLQPTLGSILLLFVGIAAVRALLQRGQARLNAAVRENFTTACRMRVYRAMAAAEWRFLVTRPPSAFVHTLTGEVGRVGVAVNHVTGLAVEVMASLVYIALALRLAPMMAVLVMGSAGVLAWSLRGSIDGARASGERASGGRAQLHAAVADHIASLKTARSYGVVERHTEVFLDLSRASRAVSLEAASGESDLQQSLELGSTILLALIVYVSSTIIGVSPALLLVLLFIFARLMPRLVTIYRRVQVLALTLPAIEAVTRLEHECLSAAEPMTAPEREMAPLAESIRFENVSFAYDRRAGLPAVSGLNLQITAGLTTAIVGPSGSGKTTVADLLMGLLPPATGRILVDGEALTSHGLRAWRRQIGYVAQDTFLLHDTVRANLVWARPEATDDDVWRALRLSAADRFVEDLPRGLDTMVGERGVLVSGGERQRLSIARALLREPRILVLDEATSSLDAENERRIQQAIDGLQHRMTVVIVTHRLSTIKHADVIHVMDGGRVVQSGTWDALRAERHGRFYTMAQLVDGDAIRETA